MNAKHLNTSISVTAAEADDIIDIIDLCELWLEDAGIYDGQVDREKVARLMLYLIQGGGQVVLAKDAGRVAGVIAGGVVERWYSSERLAQTFLAYVLPEYRDGSAMDLLVWEFQARAVKAGAGMVEMALMASASAAGLRSSAERAGFAPIADYFGWRPVIPASFATQDGRH